MDIKIIRKPAVLKTKCERLKICLEGAHSLDEKAAMFLSAIAFLQHKGFTHAQASDFYIALVDADNYGISHFPDGTLIADHTIVVPAPYACAADHYDKKFHLPIPRHR